MAYNHANARKAGSATRGGIHDRARAIRCIGPNQDLPVCHARDKETSDICRDVREDAGAEVELLHAGPLVYYFPLNHFRLRFGESALCPCPGMTGEGSGAGGMTTGGVTPGKFSGFGTRATAWSIHA